MVSSIVVGAFGHGLVAVAVCSALSFAQPPGTSAAVRCAAIASGWPAFVWRNDRVCRWDL